MCPDDGAAAGMQIPETRRAPSLVAIGASTGGVAALEEILCGLYPPTPPILVVQHMPQHFLRRLAAHLRETVSLDIRLVGPSSTLRENTVFLAEGGTVHLAVQRAGEAVVAQPVAADATDLYTPSVDQLFNSIALAGCAPGTLAIVLTGMGADGASGLCALRSAGAQIWVEDPADSAVPTMPHAAIATGTVERVLRRAHIADALAAEFSKPLALDRI